MFLSDSCSSTSWDLERHWRPHRLSGLLLLNSRFVCIALPQGQQYASGCMLVATGSKVTHGGNYMGRHIFFLPFTGRWTLRHVHNMFLLLTDRLNMRILSISCIMGKPSNVFLTIFAKSSFLCHFIHDWYWLLPQCYNMQYWLALLVCTRKWLMQLVSNSVNFTC